MRLERGIDPSRNGGPLIVRACWTVTLLAVAAGLAFGQSPARRKPLLGKAPPELIANADDWLAGPAVSLRTLQGKVVWLQFNF
jgi:hypothetical protein